MPLARTVPSCAVLLAAGVALAPMPTPPAPAAIAPDVELTASSVFNIPANLIEAVANIPANEVRAWQALADSLNYGGSWTVLNPLNVLGFDSADPPKVKALIAALLPIPALAGPLADQLNIFLQAELAMNAGCGGFPVPCADPLALIGGMFQVSLLQLLQGYTFPEIENPLVWPDGTTTTPPWSGQTVRLDPLAPLVSVINSLLEEPSGIEIVPPAQVLTTVGNLLESFNNAFNPYVPGSYSLDPELTPIGADILNALEPILGWTAPDPDEAVPTPDSELEETPVDTIVVPWPSWTPTQEIQETQETQQTQETPDESEGSTADLADVDADLADGAADLADGAADSADDTEPRHRSGIPARDLIERLSDPDADGTSLSDRLASARERLRSTLDGDTDDSAAGASTQTDSAQTGAQSDRDDASASAADSH